ncbi:(d)CMP kinase [Marinicella sp. W31]|uniref:(d)CMP kinase n=1 Tax=Marinicella sp. W31 TaxID=3023713 RepID=UPI003757DF0D
MYNLIPVITIDGPSGVGKGTISALLANFLNWHLLDSGTIYRALALTSLNHNIAATDVEALVEHAESLDLEFKTQLRQATEIYLEGHLVNEDLRSEACGERASEIAVIAEVRSALLQRQKAFRQPPGLVADGRDMGTVVFTDADLKFFLTASSEERAKRRHLQLKKKGFDVNIGALLSDIEKRDERDRNRKVSPLLAAEDAHVIDTSHLSVDQVLELVVTRVKEQAFFKS